LSLPETANFDGPRGGFILFSRDDGMSWSQPRPAPLPLDRCAPINLGGSRLMLRDGGNLVVSNDYGQTWSAPEPIPALPDGRPMYSDVAMNGLVEGDTIRLIFYTEKPSDIPGKTWTEGGWTGQSLIMSYNVKTKQWSEPVFFPKTPADGPEWATSEGSLTRAKNGNLVAAFRSRRPKLTTVKSDAWRAIRTAVSTDDGKTWSKPALHSPLGYGLVHMSLLPFPDGRILMTYAARVGEVDGKVYHGIEAVFSHDNGQTWDWQHRYILYRGRDLYMHSPQSVLLSDGRVLTVLMEHINFTHSERPFDAIPKLVTLPEEWHWRSDPDNRGLAEGWYKEASFDTWDRMMRIDNFWTRQGEPRGVGWYAINFEVPDAGGKPLVLLFYAVDGLCDIFIDGERVGERKGPLDEIWDMPFHIPLDKGLAPGRHRLVVRVEKDRNEAGIYKPVAIAEKSRLVIPPREKVAPLNISHTSVVIWSPDQPTPK